MAISIPVPGAKPFPPFPVLSTRQEAFCRGFIATGNAAEAARRAGYAERSARQTGHALMERPHIVERVREVRLLWRETARQETGILLDRLEQAWEVAVAKGSPFMMLQVIRLQADLSGLSRRGRHRRADLWPLPDEDEFGELAAALEAMDDPDFSGTAQPGPLAAALHRRNGGAGAETAVEDGAGGRQGGSRSGHRPGHRPGRPGGLRRSAGGTLRCGAAFGSPDRPRPPEGRRRRHRRRAKTAGCTRCAAATTRSIPARRKKWRCGRKTRPASRRSAPASTPGKWRRWRAAAPQRRYTQTHDGS